MSTLTLVGMLLICAVNAWLFSAVCQCSYLEWYAESGPFIALASAAFAAAWGELDNNPALVSAHPLTYVGACLQIAGLPLVTIGTHRKSVV